MLSPNWTVRLEGLPALGSRNSAIFSAAFRRALGFAVASWTTPNKASSACRFQSRMAGTTAGVCNPLDATAEPSMARASCAMVLPANARGRPVRDDRQNRSSVRRPAFDRRGAHPAWSLAACFTLPALRQRCALGSLIPNTVESAPRLTDFRPARFHRRFHLAD
jgi:hypothetical protein